MMISEPSLPRWVRCLVTASLCATLGVNHLTSACGATAYQREALRRAMYSDQPLVKLSRTSRAAEDVRALVPGMPVERELTQDETHTYSITLTQGQYLRLVIEQRSVNIRVKLFAPGAGLLLTEVNNASVGEWERISIVADVSGEYRIEVRPVEKDLATGVYELKIEELRGTTLQDRSRVAAERVFAEGQLLRGQGTADSRRRAIQKYEASLPLWGAASDIRGEAEALSKISEVSHELSDNRTALERGEQALRLWRAAGDRSGEAGTLIRIGLAHWALNDYQKALEDFDRLRAGNLTADSDFLWLFHEMQHFVQCGRVGGRGFYAKMWFDQLETTFIQNNNLATLHDRMPMEGEADTVANTVFGAIGPSRNSNGRLVRSITLELLRNHQVIPVSNTIPHITQTPQTLTARVTGFSSPPPIGWDIKRPNQVFTPATGSGPNNTELQWTPDQAGTHLIRVTINSASATEGLVRVVGFNVLAPGQQPPGTPPPQDVYETPAFVPKPEQVRLIVTVQRNGETALAPINICVSDNETQQVYARALIQRGLGSFTVRKNRAIKIIISGGGGFRGETRIVQMGETQQPVTITQHSGSTGPFCGIS